MSFGISVGDFLAVGKLAHKVYKDCRNAPSQYQEAGTVARQLEHLVDDLQDDVRLKRFDHGRLEQLSDHANACKDVLHKVETMLEKYAGLSLQSKLTWDRLKWDQQRLAELQLQLTSNVTLLNNFYLSSVASSQYKLQKAVEELIRNFERRQDDMVEVASAITMQDDSAETQSAWNTISSDLALLGIDEHCVRLNRDLIVNRILAAVHDTKLSMDDIDPDDSKSLSDDVAVGAREPAGSYFISRNSTLVVSDKSSPTAQPNMFTSSFWRGESTGSSPERPSGYGHEQDTQTASHQDTHGFQSPSSSNAHQSSYNQPDVAHSTSMSSQSGYAQHNPRHSNSSSNDNGNNQAGGLMSSIFGSASGKSSQDSQNHSSNQHQAASNNSQPNGQHNEASTHSSAGGSSGHQQHQIPSNNGQSSGQRNEASAYSSTADNNKHQHPPQSTPQNGQNSQSQHDTRSQPQNRSYDSKTQGGSDQGLKQHTNARTSSGERNNGYQSTGRDERDSQQQSNRSGYDRQQHEGRPTTNTPGGHFDNGAHGQTSQTSNVSNGNLRQCDERNMAHTSQGSTGGMHTGQEHQQRNDPNTSRVSRQAPPSPRSTGSQQPSHQDNVNTQGQNHNDQITAKSESSNRQASVSSAASTGNNDHRQRNGSGSQRGQANGASSNSTPQQSTVSSSSRTDIPSTSNAQEHATTGYNNDHIRPHESNPQMQSREHQPNVSQSQNGQNGSNSANARSDESNSSNGKRASQHTMHSDNPPSQRGQQSTTHAQTDSRQQTSSSSSSPRQNNTSHSPEQRCNPDTQGDKTHGSPSSSQPQTRSPEQSHMTSPQPRAEHSRDSAANNAHQDRSAGSQSENRADGTNPGIRYDGPNSNATKGQSSNVESHSRGGGQHSSSSGRTGMHESGRGTEPQKSSQSFDTRTSDTSERGQQQGSSSNASSRGSGRETAQNTQDARSTFSSNPPISGQSGSSHLSPSASSHNNTQAAGREVNSSTPATRSANTSRTDDASNRDNSRIAPSAGSQSPPTPDHSRASPNNGRNGADTGRQGPRNEAQPQSGPRNVASNSNYEDRRSPESHVNAKSPNGGLRSDNEQCSNAKDTYSQRDGSVSSNAASSDRQDRDTSNSNTTSSHTSVAHSSTQQSNVSQPREPSQRQQGPGSNSGSSGWSSQSSTQNDNDSTRHTTQQTKDTTVSGTSSSNAQRDQGSQNHGSNLTNTSQGQRSGASGNPQSVSPHRGTSSSPLTSFNNDRPHRQSFVDEVPQSHGSRDQGASAHDRKDFDHSEQTGASARESPEHSTSRNAQSSASSRNQGRSNGGPSSSASNSSSFSESRKGPALNARKPSPIREESRSPNPPHTSQKSSQSTNNSSPGSTSKMSAGSGSNSQNSSTISTPRNSPTVARGSTTTSNGRSDRTPVTSRSSTPQEHRSPGGSEALSTAWNSSHPISSSSSSRRDESPARPAAKPLQKSSNTALRQHAQGTSSPASASRQTSSPGGKQQNMAQNSRNSRNQTSTRSPQLSPTPNTNGSRTPSSRGVYNVSKPQTLYPPPSPKQSKTASSTGSRPSRGSEKPTVNTSAASAASNGYQTGSRSNSRTESAAGKQASSSRSSLDNQQDNRQDFYDVKEYQSSPDSANDQRSVVDSAYGSSIRTSTSTDSAKSDYQGKRDQQSSRQSAQNDSKSRAPSSGRPGQSSQPTSSSQGKSPTARAGGKELYEIGARHDISLEHSRNDYGPPSEVGRSNSSLSMGSDVQDQSIPTLGDFLSTFARANTSADDLKTTLVSIHMIPDADYIIEMSYCKLLLGIKYALEGQAEDAFEYFSWIFRNGVDSVGFQVPSAKSRGKLFHVSTSAAIWLGDLSLVTGRPIDTVIAWSWAIAMVVQHEDELQARRDDNESPAFVDPWVIGNVAQNLDYVLKNIKVAADFLSGRADISQMSRWISRGSERLVSQFASSRKIVMECFEKAKGRSYSNQAEQNSHWNYQTWDRFLAHWRPERSADESISRWRGRSATPKGSINLDERFLLKGSAADVADIVAFPYRKDPHFCVDGSVAIFNLRYWSDTEPAKDITPKRKSAGLKCDFTTKANLAAVARASGTSSAKGIPIKVHKDTLYAFVNWTGDSSYDPQGGVSMMLCFELTPFSATLSGNGIKVKEAPEWSSRLLHLGNRSRSNTIQSREVKELKRRIVSALESANEEAKRNRTANRRAPCEDKPTAYDARNTTRNGANANRNGSSNTSARGSGSSASGSTASKQSTERKR